MRNRHALSLLKFGAVIFAAAVIFPATVSASAVLAEPNLNELSNGLVGYWPLDANTTNWSTGITKDTSGQGNNGQIGGMSTSTSPVAGKVGQALYFNGSSSYLTMGNVDNINGPITISAWVYCQNATSPAFPQIIQKDANEGYTLFLFGSTNQVGFRTDSVSITAETSAGLSAGQWYLVTGEYDGTSLKLFVNGVLQSSVSGPAPAPASSPLTIGDYGAGSADYFNGVIDDVRLYSRALSAQEIQLLYAMGEFNSTFELNIGHSNTSPGTGLNRGLVGYWTFDGPTINWNTSTAADSSGNSNTGQLIGMSTTTSPTIGKIGQALNFNGTNQYIIANGYNYSSMSACAWVKLNVPISQYKGIVEFSTSADVRYGIGFDTTGQPEVMAGNTFQDGPSTLAINTWYDLCGTYDGLARRLYVNGVAVTLGTNQAGLTNQASTLAIGKFAVTDTTSYDLSGTIDDVRIYNRVLSAQEVAQLYAQGAANIAHSNTNSGTGLNAGLLGYWTFDGPTINWNTGTVADVSGNGHNGQAVGMSTTTSPTTGKIGQALSFNGTNEILVPSASAFDPTKLTVSMWVSPSSLPSGTVLWSLIANYNFITSKGWDIYLTSAGKLEFFDAQTTETSSGTVVTGKWQHVVVTHDGAQDKFYINGVLTDIIPDTSSILPSTAPFTIGYPIIGAIDDVRLYNRVLSPQEIADLYLLAR